MVVVRARERRDYWGSVRSGGLVFVVRAACMEEKLISHGVNEASIDRGDKDLGPPNAAPNKEAILVRGLGGKFMHR